MKAPRKHPASDVMVAETLNGFPVVMSARVFAAPGTRQRRVVMVDKGAFERHRYVTCVHCDGDSEWSHGNYFADLPRAKADFAKRAGLA